MDMNKYDQSYLRYSLGDVNLNNISGSLLNNSNGNGNINGDIVGSYFQPQPSLIGGGGSIGSIGSNNSLSGPRPNFRNFMSPSSTPSTSANGNINSSSLLSNLSGGSGSGSTGNWGQSPLLSSINNHNNPNSYTSSPFSNNSSLNNSNPMDPFSIQLSPSPSTQVNIFNNSQQPTTVTKPSIKSTGFNLNSSSGIGGNGNNSTPTSSTPNNSVTQSTKSPLSNSGGNPSQSTSSVSLLSSPNFQYGGSAGNGMGNTNSLSQLKDYSFGVDALSPLTDERLPSTRYDNEHDSSLKSQWYQSKQPFDYFVNGGGTSGSGGYHSENNSLRSVSPSPNRNGFIYAGSAPQQSSSTSFTDGLNGKINSPTGSISNSSNANISNVQSSSSFPSNKSLLEFQMHENHQKQQLIQIQLQQLQLQQQQLQYQQQHQQFQLHQQQHHQHQPQQPSSITNSPSLSSANISSPFFKHQTLNNTITTYSPLDTSSLIQSYDNIFDNSSQNNEESINSALSSINTTPILQPQSPRNLLNTSNSTNQNNINLNNNNLILQPQSPRSLNQPQSPSSSNSLKKESFIVSFKDTPSRNLFVRNVNPIVEDEDLQNMFQSYGPVKHTYCSSKSRGFVIVSYYDIRHATQAFKNLQNTEVCKKKIKIHYCISKDYSDQGTLVVFNLDSSITNHRLTQIFGIYGSIKEIRETPNKTHHKFIEYYDIRHASDAIKHLNKIELCGKKLRIQHSRPGGFNKNLFPTDGTPTSNTNNANVSEYSIDDSSSITANFFDDDLVGSNGNANGVKKGKKNGSVSNSIDQSTSSSFNDMMDEHELGDMMSEQLKFISGGGSNSGSRSQTPISHDHLLVSNSPPTNSKLILGASPSLSQPLSPIPSPSSSTSSTPTISARFSKPIIPLLGLTSLDSDLTNSPPLSPLSPLSGKLIKSPRSNNDKLINSPRTANSKENMEDKIQYNFILEDVKSGLDTRTSIMIKNIPNRLSQTILLSIVDEHFKGAYDFLYLPIDPHTKVNYGYAFINFINYKHLVPFYLEFNSRKWEKFYCSKVCEITYARIQGKIALIQHLRNTSLGSHNKKISPIVFVSDISGSGEKPLHLATFSVDVFM